MNPRRLLSQLGTNAWSVLAFGLVLALTLVALHPATALSVGQSSDGPTATPAGGSSAQTPSEATRHSAPLASLHLPGSPASDANNSSDGNASHQQRTSITNVSVVGKGVVMQKNGTTYVWQSEQSTVSFDYRIRSQSKSVAYGQSACLTFVNSSGNRTTYSCVKSSPTNHRRSVNVTLKQWPMDAGGIQTHPAIVVKHSNISGTTVLARKNVSAKAIKKNGDTDKDGLKNVLEVRYGTSMTTMDTDGDGLLDGPEVHNYHTDPTKTDTDGDNLSDAREINLGTNPNVKDTDHDGVPDGKEVQLGTNPLKSDTDGDGLSDGKELKIGTNPKKADTDGDGLSDSFEYHAGLNPTTPLDVVGIGVVSLALPLTVGLVLVDRGLASMPRGLTGAIAGLVALLEPEGPSENTTATESPSGGGTEPPTNQTTTDAGGYATDTDRVVAIVENAGGRIKQSEIVEETGWSKAKVSRLLSRMDDDGEITKVRLGRENLICVDDEAPDRGPDSD